MNGLIRWRSESAIVLSFRCVGTSASVLLTGHRSCLGLRLAVDATGQLVNNPGTLAEFAQSIERQRARVAETVRKLGLNNAE